MQFTLGIFLIWRIGLFFIAAIGEKILSFSPSFPYSDIYLIPSGLPHWLWSFANFDGVHYLTIAEKGYSAQFTQVFFPLYPLLIGIFNNILPFINPIITGLFISNMLFLFSLMIFRKLMRLDYKEKEIKWMIAFLLFFPTSFFLGSLYTESLFFFLVISSFYMARKKRWILAGILGAFASATKLVGILLLPALLWEWWQANRSKYHVLGIKYKKILHTIFYILHSPIIYLIPLGLITYTIYLQQAFGDWLYFWHAQPVFGAERSGTGIIILPQVIWRYLKMLVTNPYTQYSFWVALWELGSLVVSCSLLVIGLLKKVRMSYLIFGFLTVIVPTLTGTLSSMPRYILVAFPIFISLGLIRNRLERNLLFVICCLLSVIFTILFTSGRWVS